MLPPPTDSGPFPVSKTTIRSSTTIARESLVPCALSPACGLWSVVGRDGSFKQANTVLVRRLGWTISELLARPFVEFVHPHDRAATLSEFAKLEAGDEPVTFQNRFARSDGTYLWLQWSAQPVRGQPLIQASAQDVTTQRSLEKEVMEISDREKDRIGRDLHDGLCQKLAGITALSATLSRQLGPESESGAAAAEIAGLLKETITEARNLARGLNPVNLDGSGLIGALNTFAANTQALFRISCTFRCSRSSIWLGAEVETHLYRIAQEAVQNSIRHGQATRISITLCFAKGKGTLGIRDNGTGITAEPGRGIGMHTMDYRARLIGASLWVRPDDRRGTRVDCVFGLSTSIPEAGRHD